MNAAQNTRSGTRPLRVLHVITALAPAGAEREVELLARAQPGAKVVALYDGGAVADALLRDGYDVRVLGMDGWRKLLAWPRLARLMRRLRPDVVHVHLLSGQLWGIPAARLARVPVTVSAEHSLNPTMIEGRQHSPTLIRLYRGLAALATHTVAVSEMTRQHLVDWGVRPESISVIDNGLDFEAMSFDAAARDRVRSEFDVPDGTTLIGAVGRLAPAKRFDRVIAALAPTLGPDRRLLIVGDGTERDNLARQAADLGVADYVQFAGPRSDMRDVYSAMDLLIGPSWAETFGIAVVEARACGVPVIYSTAPAIAELPEPLEGTYPIPLVDDDTELDAIRSAVDRALRERAAAGGGRLGPPHALAERFSMRQTADDLDALYRRLLVAARGRRTGRSSV